MNKNHFTIPLLLALFLVACGGNRGPGGPTAIPPDVVRPAQSTPEFIERRDPIVIPTLSPTPPESVGLSDASDVVTRSSSAARVPVTALGIATGSTTLYAAPAGNGLATLPTGTTFTVTGISADSAYYAAYTSAGQAGWIDATQLTLFGGENLAVVSNLYQPSALATTLAQAMQPINVLDALVAQSTPLPQDIDVNSVTASIVNAAPVLPNFALNDGLAASGSESVLGLVQTEGGTLNVRAGPGTEFAIIGQVGDGQQVGVVGFNEAGDWFQIVGLQGEGWVAGEFVSLQ